MPDERTPLIAVVQIRPHRDRYPHHTLRYVCTLLLTVALFTGLIAVVLILNFAPLDDGSETEFPLALPFRKHDIPASWPHSTGLDYTDLQEILRKTPDAEKAREWSRYYTSGPHLAGKNLSQAIWTKEKWIEFGVENSLIVDYDIYVNYPLGHRLALLEKSNDDWEVKYEARLEEDVLDEDGTSGLANRIPTFHGYSASGNVTAPYVYVNYGTFKDFEELQAANISLSGKIALVKYGGIFRGLKVKRAQELGMVGAIIYTDPGDDGAVTEHNGNATYPDGPARQPSSVQRGSCQFLSMWIQPFLSQLPNIMQALLRETQPLQVIPLNRECLASPSTTRFPPSPRSPSRMKTRSHCSRPSMVMDQRHRRLINTGKEAVSDTKA